MGHRYPKKPTSLGKNSKEIYGDFAYIDMQRRLTWKETMENGSLESYSPHFTEVMLWANIRWAPMGKY